MKLHLIGVTALMFGAAAGSPASQTPADSELMNVCLPGIGISMPAKLTRVLPAYPLQAVVAGQHGVTEVEIVVGTSGTVIDARLVKTVDNGFGLDQLALEAAKRWTFQPGLRIGNPVPTLALIRTQFDLPTAADQPASVSAELSNLTDRSDLTTAVPGVVVTPQTPGVRPPRVIRRVQPSYTSDAMRAKIQGDVTLTVVIAADGQISAVRVARSLDDRFGLDAQAIRAVSHWLFEPATQDGRAAPFLATVILSFRLH